MLQLQKKAELIGFRGQDHCRVLAMRFPLIDARYEVSGRINGAEFRGTGKLRQAEELMSRNKAPMQFYDLLVRAGIKVGEQKLIEPDLDDAQKRCIISLGIWKQSISCVSTVTGMGLETTREALHSLYSDGYVSMVRRNGEMRYSLTPKGEAVRKSLKNQVGYTRIQKECLSAATKIDWNTGTPQNGAQPPCLKS